MYSPQEREAWIRHTAGWREDGTLAKRLAGLLSASKWSLAGETKTGSISSSESLSGYTRQYAFSILVNNSNHEAAEVRRVVDRIALTLVN